MNKVIKKIFSIALLISLMLLQASCRPKEEHISKLRIAHFPNATHSQALMMKHTGILQERIGNDISVEFIQFNAGASEIEAFFSGQIDIGYIGPVPAINGNIKSRGDIVIIAGASISGGAIVVGIESGIQKIEDLENKRIAVPQIGNTQHITLLNLLSENGLKDSVRGGNVEIIPVANSNLKLAFERNEIDAAYIPEPWGSNLVNSGIGRLLLDDSKIFREGEYTTALVVAKKEFIEKYPEIVEIFLDTHIEMTEFFHSDPENAKNIAKVELERILGYSIEDEAINLAYKRVLVSYDPLVDGVLELADVFYEAKMVDDAVDKDSLFSLRMLKKALAERNIEVDY